MPDLFLQSDAVLSTCGHYRYTLTRTWEPGAGRVCFIMLNPSTADASQDDPTIRRCMRFARDWGWGGLVVANLFAWRATDPRALRRSMGPVGPDNDRCIVEAAWESSVTVAAWGAGGDYLGRDKEALALLHARGLTVHCLGLTASGHPRHPLYVRADTRPIVLEPPHA